MKAAATIPADDGRCRSIGRESIRWTSLAIGLVVLGAVCFASLSAGARSIVISATVDALLAYDGSLTDHIIVHHYRLPRTLLGLLCGAAFGVSGALIQAATRNPLADPGLLGVNAGAACFVTLAVGLFGWQTIDAYIWASFAGAIVVAVVVYTLGAIGRDGATPVRLVLSGVAISAVLAGIGSSITLLDPQVFDALRMWSIGSIAGRNMQVVGTVTPFVVTGLVVALLVAKSLNAVALGDDLARTLGSRVVLVRVLAVIAITLLSGAGTAAAGPIAFVGLMVPHVMRWLTGPDQRWIIGLTIIYAPILLLVADIAGRLVLYPAELETGIVTAFVGAPVLILLVRRTKASGL